MSQAIWHWTKQAAHNAVRMKVWEPKSPSRKKGFIRGWKYAPHATKMLLKRNARDKLSAQRLAEPQTQEYLRDFSAYWRHVRRLHGVGSRALRLARREAA